MRMRLSWACVVVVGLTLVANARAQVTGRSAGGQALTITGCVQREVDVLRTSPGNLGLADEFVLIRSSAKAASAAPATPGREGAARGVEDAAATSGPYGRVYRLSGDQEKQLKDHVGQQVEITASFDSDTDARIEAQRDAAAPKTASTPDRRPEAKDVPKMSVQSIRPLGGACSGPAQK